jgi:hypothetical protein
LPPELGRIVRSFETLSDVIAAGFAVLDVVVQDEFTHDVVVRPPGQSAVWLVLDST